MCGLLLENGFRRRCIIHHNRSSTVRWTWFLHHHRSRSRPSDYRKEKAEWTSSEVSGTRCSYRNDYHWVIVEWLNSFHPGLRIPSKSTALKKPWMTTISKSRMLPVLSSMNIGLQPIDLRYDFHSLIHSSSIRRVCGDEASAELALPHDQKYCSSSPCSWSGLPSALDVANCCTNWTPPANTSPLKNSWNIVWSKLCARNFFERVNSIIPMNSK